MRTKIDEMIWMIYEFRLLTCAKTVSLFFSSVFANHQHRQSARQTLLNERSKEVLDIFFFRYGFRFHTSIVVRTAVCLSMVSPPVFLHVFVLFIIPVIHVANDGHQCNEQRFGRVQCWRRIQLSVTVSIHSIESIAGLRRRSTRFTTIEERIFGSFTEIVGRSARVPIPTTDQYE